VLLLAATCVAINSCTREVAPRPDGAPGSATSAPVYSGYPDWSPDGASIAYFAEVDGDTTDTEIYVIAVDGTGPRRLTHSPGLDLSPVWSPDSERIAMRADPESDGSTQVWLMRSDRSELRRLTPM